MDENQGWIIWGLMDLEVGGGEVNGTKLAIIYTLSSGSERLYVFT